MPQTEDYSAAPLGLYNKTTNEQIPLYFVDIEGEVVDQFAKIKLTHRYFNPTDQVLDTIFKFPKGLYQVFDGLTVEMNGKTIIGLIGEKKKAREQYEKAVKEGKTAVKTESIQTSKDNFQYFDLLITNIGNIPPMQSINLVFSFIQQLDISCNKKFSLILPLTLTPRYIPSSTIADIITKYITERKVDQEEINSIKNSSDIKYIKTGKGLEYLYNVKLNIHSTFEITNIQTKITTPTIITKINKYNAEVTLDNGNNNIPNEDFVLEYEINENELVKPKLLLTKHPKYEDDYAFWYSFNPYNGLGKEQKISPYIEDFQGNFIFCIDRSGSMWGQRIEIAKQSLLYFLKSLPDNNSNFNVISFGSEYMPLYKNCVAVNEKNIEKAINQVYEFKADMGGTELKGALQYIESLAKNSVLGTRVFILTDGSLFDTNDCLNQVQKTISEMDIRYYSLGIGNGCSEALIKGIALKGAGEFEFSKNELDMSEKVIYLLESSMKNYLQNCKISLSNYADKILSNINDEEYLSQMQRIDKNFLIYGIIPKEAVGNNSINISYYIANQKSKQINHSIELPFTSALTSDILHKFIIGTYFPSLNNCIKYKVLSRETSLFCVIQENDLTEEQILNKYIQEINSPLPKDFDGTIIVKIITGNELPLRVNFHLSVEELKEILEEKTGIPVDQQMLYFYGKLLKDSRLLTDYNIQDGDTLHITKRLCGGGETVWDLSIFLDGIKQPVNMKIYPDSKHENITYANFRKELCQLLKIKENEYDFLNEEELITHKEGVIQTNLKTININTKKLRGDEHLPIEDRIIKNQKVNGLWELNENNLYLMNFTPKGWSQFIESHNEYFKSLNLGNDEKIFFNMVIICFIYHHYKSNLGKFKLILQKTAKQIKKTNKNYSEQKQNEFNNKIILSLEQKQNEFKNNEISKKSDKRHCLIY